jgi:nucleoside-diphosphate-sugar epimerase
LCPFDSLDPHELQDIFWRIRPDVVFHLAAAQKLQHTPDDIRPMIEANVLLGTLLAEASASTDVEAFVNVGSFSQRYRDRPYSPT